MYEMRCVPNFQHYCYYYYLFIRLHIGTGFHITLNWLTHKIKHKRIYSDRIRCIIHFLQIGNGEHDRFAIQMAFSPLRFILQKTDENITARDVHLTLNHNQKLIKLAFTGKKRNETAKLVERHDQQAMTTTTTTTMMKKVGNNVEKWIPTVSKDTIYSI